MVTGTMTYTVFYFSTQSTNCVVENMIFSDSQCPALGKEKTNFKILISRAKEKEEVAALKREKEGQRRTLLFLKIHDCSGIKSKITLIRHRFMVIHEAMQCKYLIYELYPYQT